MLYCFRWDGSSRGDACGDGGHLSCVAFIGHACALGGLVDVPLDDGDVTAAQELNHTLPELRGITGKRNVMDYSLAIFAEHFNSAMS